MLYIIHYTLLINYKIHYIYYSLVQHILLSQVQHMCPQTSFLPFHIEVKIKHLATTTDNADNIIFSGTEVILFGLRVRKYLVLATMQREIIKQIAEMHSEMALAVVWIAGQKSSNFLAKHLFLPPL